jgi:hypothetical protein
LRVSAAGIDGRFALRRLDGTVRRRCPDSFVQATVIELRMLLRHLMVLQMPCLSVFFSPWHFLVAISHECHKSRMNPDCTSMLTQLCNAAEYQQTVRAKGNVQVYCLTEADIQEILDDADEKAFLVAAAKEHFAFVHKDHLAMLWSLLMQSLLRYVCKCPKREFENSCRTCVREKVDVCVSLYITSEKRGVCVCVCSSSFCVCL